MPLTYEPRAAPWEHLLVEKIFQKGGSGVSGIARWLQRHVRATDYTCLLYTSPSPRDS